MRDNYLWTFGRRVAVVVLTVSSGLVSAAPLNDDFDSAEVISGSLTQVSGTLVGSTDEAGEEPQGRVIGSVWYSWTAPRNGLLGVGAEFLNANGDRRVQIHQLNGVRSIFSLVALAVEPDRQTPFIRGFGVAGGVEYFFQVYHRDTNAIGPFTLTLAFTPIYSSAVGFAGATPVLGKRTKITGRVTVPGDVGNIVVRSSGKGRAKNVTYNGRTGEFSFFHVRKGPPAKRGRLNNVTYTAYAVRGGTVIGQASKTYRVR